MEECDEDEDEEDDDDEDEDDKEEDDDRVPSRLPILDFRFLSGFGKYCGDETGVDNGDLIPFEGAGEFWGVVVVDEGDEGDDDDDDRVVVLTGVRESVGLEDLSFLEDLEAS